MVGIELLAIDARIVIASVDTYLRFAEAVGRLDLSETETQGLPGVINEVREGGSSSKAKGVIQGVKEAVGGDDDKRQKQSSSTSSRRRSDS